MNNTMDISLCVMVKDESKELEVCLSHFQHLTQKMLVLDTGSSKEVRQVIEKFKAKRYPFEWVDDFALARNEILKQVNDEWIMMVDADDSMDLKAIQQLKNELVKVKEKADVILLPYVYAQMGSQKANTAYLPRIWKKSLGLQYIYPIHEYLDLSKVDRNRIVKIDVPVLHSKDPSNFSGSFERNLKLIKEHLKTHPKDLRMLYYWVHDSQQVKKYEEVILGAKKYVDAHPKDLVKLFKVLIRKGKAHVHLGEVPAAKEAFLLAMSVQPLLIESYLELGNLYRKQKRFAEAEHFYRCALLCKKPKQSFNFHNEALYDSFAMRKLSELLKTMGRPKEALDYAEKLLKSYPKDKKLKVIIKALKSSL